MPAVRDHKPEKKRFYCDYEECNRSFTRPYDLRRHKRTHCDYNDREFACPYPNCIFRSNQGAGLKCHVNSIHTGVRVHCDLCPKSFSDPSSLSKHKVRVHNLSLPDDQNIEDFNRLVETEGDQSKRYNAPYAPPVHRSIVRHVEENSRHGVRDILSQFATFALRNEEAVDAANFMVPTAAARPKKIPSPPSDRSSDHYSQTSSERAVSTSSTGLSSTPGYASIVHSPANSSDDIDSDYGLS